MKFEIIALDIRLDLSRKFCRTSKSTRNYFISKTWIKRNN